MRKMEFREALDCLVEQADILLYMTGRFVEGEAFNNFALAVGLKNLRIYIEELHNAIN
jgi:hypothetical protein